MEIKKKAPATAKSRSPGRPRSAALHHAILDVTARILGAGGYAGLTIEKVAEQAGVARQTVYRRWPTKLALVIDLLREVSESAPLPDTGSIQTDLRQLYRRYSKAIITSGGPIIPGLIAESLYNDELAEVVRSYLMTRRQRAITLVKAAVKRGELPASTKPELVIDLLTGFLWYRRLIVPIPLGARDDEAVVEILLHGAGGTTASRPATITRSRRSGLKT